jgi:ABC-2 type transport system ATP-binding protein
MVSLQASNLTKHYGKVRALRNVSFGVQAGDIFGYLGPNGAGKTTTLRVVVGLIHADSGEVRVFDRRTAGAEERVAVGYLPGEFHLYGNMTALSVLDYFARYRPTRPPILRNKLIKAFEVDQAVLSQKVKFLSHGTKQKIGLIIAMQHDPELLLLDEPTSGLDPLIQHAFREIVLDFAACGRAVFFSSHVLSEVETVCGRVAILRAGEIVAEESIENLRNKMVRRLRIRARAPLPLDLEKTAGVARTQISGNQGVLWIKGEVNPVLRRLALLDIDQFVFPEPELEDIFLSFYQSGGKANA